MFYEFEHDRKPYYVQNSYSKNLIFPAHLHRAFEFVTVLSGRTKIIVDSSEYMLEKGESMLIFPFQIHSRESRDSDCRVAIFSHDFVSSYWSSISQEIPQSNKFIPSEFLINKIESISVDSPLVEKKAYLYLLCAEFHKNAKYKKREHPDGNALTQIFEFIEDNYLSEDCLLTRMALEKGYNPSYLSRIFKKKTGVSFNFYVNSRRINKACYLLTNSDKSILECSYECGYTSLRSFNRNFKACTGMTPVEYIRKKVNSSGQI